MGEESEMREYDYIPLSWRVRHLQLPKVVFGPKSGKPGPEGDDDEEASGETVDVLDSTGLWPWHLGMSEVKSEQ